MKLWFDDKRTPLPGYNVWVKSAFIAIEQLKTNKYKEISLDHDVGPETLVGKGIDVVKFIEDAAFTKKLKPLKSYVHTSNMGVQTNMHTGLLNASRFWKRPDTAFIRHYDHEVQCLLQESIEKWTALKVAWDRVFEKHMDDFEAVMTLV